MYIYSNTAAGLLFVETEKKMDAWRILDGEGTEVSCPVMGVREEDGKVLCTLDARNLKPWSVEQPQLYTLEADGESVRFGPRHQHGSLLC